MNRYNTFIEFWFKIHRFQFETIYPQEFDQNGSLVINLEWWRGGTIGVLTLHGWLVGGRQVRGAFKGCEGNTLTFRGHPHTFLAYNMAKTGAHFCSKKRKFNCQKLFLRNKSISFWLAEHLIFSSRNVTKAALYLSCNSLS